MTLDSGGTGWLSTDGSKIIDENGFEVRLTGVNWYGTETADFAPQGLWGRNYKAIIDDMAGEGFNTIRLPFSNDALHNNASPTNSAIYTNNPELIGLTTLEVMDEIVKYAGQVGMRVILDNHRNSAGNGASSNGLWYGDGYSQQDWIDDWEVLADRYKNDPTVVGFDLSNEPYNATWGSGNPSTDWRLAAQQAANAIHGENPNVLVFVEGIGGDYWWGGNLSGVAQYPLNINEEDKLVFSPHVYSPHLADQPWFNGSNWGDGLTDVWDEYWGYIAKEGIAPILIGEFAYEPGEAKDTTWINELLPYVDHIGANWLYWAWNYPDNDYDHGLVTNNSTYASFDTTRLNKLGPYIADVNRVEGNSGNNVMNGTSGVDWLFGLGGNDTLKGYAGDDGLAGAGGNDVLNGNNGRDTLNGNSGNDTLDGGNNSDTLHGGGDRDVLRGGANADLLIGGSGNDSLYGEDGKDTLDGGTGNDSLAGGGGNDVLQGGDNADTLNGGSGNDTLRGGSNADVLNGNAGSDHLAGGNGHDQLAGSAGQDTLVGGDGADSLWGGKNNDTLEGEDGNDVLSGGENSDSLHGGSGNDTLTGGANNDTFVFSGSFGSDRITDFSAANGEKIDLSDVSTITSYSDLVSNHLSQNGDNAVIDAGSGNVITIVDFDSANLGSGDFLF